MKSPKFSLRTTAVFAATILGAGNALAVPVTLPGFVGFGYNTISGGGLGADGLPGALGCGPTSAAMIFNWYTTTGPAPGLIGNSLTDTRTMAGATYMNVNAGGFGNATQFQIGLEQFALDRGYTVDAQIHVEPTTFNAANWTSYNAAPIAPHVVTDATFWDDLIGFQTLDTTAFLNFVAVEIDAGRPVGVTVDSDGDAGTDHWMVLTGYDLATGQWAGYNTWDATQHWYDVESAFKLGNDMGIGYVRTFDFLGPVNTDGGGTTVPDSGSTAILLSVSMLGMAYLRRRAELILN